MITADDLAWGNLVALRRHRDRRARLRAPRRSAREQQPAARLRRSTAAPRSSIQQVRVQRGAVRPVPGQGELEPRHRRVRARAGSSHAQDPVFTTPNEIGEAAWKNWVQERGLYFLGEKDSRYRDLVQLEDPFPHNPGPKTGALVEGPVRQRALGLRRASDLWRQLPAGTDGAYQLLANLISLGKRPRADAIADRRLQIKIPHQSKSNLKSEICNLQFRDSMEIPLTPLEFARRSRALYPDREAVVDGALRLTYAQFFDRCDRWSSALQALGVKPGDRVAYIAPNTHAQLESFYAVPQIGAVLVPINYRLSPDEFAYIINHSGATVVCAHEDYLECRRRIRTAAARRPALRRARRRAREQAMARLRNPARQGAAGVRAAGDRRKRSPHHQLHERHHVAAEGRDDHPPQRLHERRRHAAAHPDADVGSLSVDAADVSRQRLDVRLERDRGGRRRTSACERSIRPRCSRSSRRESVSILCAAPTVLIGVAERVGRWPIAGARRASASSPPARRRRRRPSSGSKASSGGRSRTSTG